MAVLSSVNVTFFRVGFLSFLAFACLKDVNIILTNPSILMFTQALNLPVLTMSSYSAQLGLFAAVFSLMAIQDLVPLLEQNTQFFESVVPIRLFFFFLLTAYAYCRAGNLFLHNNAVIIYGGCEVWINFLIFSAVRDEKNERFKLSNRVTLEDEPEFLEPLTELEASEMAAQVEESNSSEEE
ncbi:LAME_0D00826g1_1 [Lachancea meyersii CBS 8951]|uniref:LAME_0D00826g1_1 n=1 Tax=Lachancea meyersii CBS 8951 TaxID=1266667 RepID=A0A1G4J6B6_9SACH|nr:LAME_0D00826g1_1 [Lachancea meyersii CBS 8951]